MKKKKISKASKAFYIALSYLSPRLNTKLLFLKKFGRFPDLKDPKTLNEKITQEPCCTLPSVGILLSIHCFALLLRCTLFQIAGLFFSPLLSNSRIGFFVRATFSRFFLTDSSEYP